MCCGDAFGDGAASGAAAAFGVGFSFVVGLGFAFPAVVFLGGMARNTPLDTPSFKYCMHASNVQSRI